MDIAAWLQGFGLERYITAFRDNEIDWEVLPRLTSIRDRGTHHAGADDYRLNHLRLLWFKMDYGTRSSGYRQANCGGECLGSAQKQETLMPSTDQVIVWIIIGLLGGSLAGLLITRERKGFGILRNLGVGLVGALVGGLVFRVLGIFPGLDKVAISLRDVVAALVGSLLVLAVIWLWQRFQKSG
jgi:uncharacterized membrane protein YeaQ/YmgE (transglycosylase-associated protein family)